MEDLGEVSDHYILRQVTGLFDEESEKVGQFKIMLDLVSKPSVPLAPQFIERKVLPLVAKETAQIFKSYKFDHFSSITVVDKNSGKLLTVFRK